MRVSFRKIHCPSFVCFFCKPPQHLCTPPNHTPAFQSAAAVASDHLRSAKKDEDDDAETESQTCSELILKSSIKRKEVEEGRMKTVKWMDVAGKELVQFKEFEISESEDTDSDSEYNRGCICPIL